VRFRLRGPVLAATLLLSTGLVGHAQPPASDQPMFRVGVDIIRIDAVVTDRDGNIVTDLTADDFELKQDGKVQPITMAQFVSIESRRAANPAPAVGKGAEPPRPPRTTTKPVTTASVRRTMVLVVDDLGIAWENVEATRKALRRFIDEDIEEGDLVGVVRTGASWGALQQLTTDKRLLHSAVDQVRWTGFSRQGVGSFTPLNSWLHTSTVGAGGAQVNTGFTNPDPLDLGDLDELREDMSASASLGAIVFAVDGIRNLPGRKAIVLVSEGFRPPEINGPDDRVMRQMDRLTDLALRTGTVIYGLDPRGLMTGGLTAEDNLKQGGSGAAAEHGIGRRRSLIETQDALATLAERTGGIAVLNNNDLARGLRRIGDDFRGYYIIGYNPPEGTIAAPGKTARFHKVSLKVRRPGVRVRTREGFIGEPDADRDTLARTPEEELRSAAISPFSAVDIPLRATLVPGYDVKQGMSVRAMLHVDARALTFTAAPDGTRAAKVSVIGIITDEWGAPQSQHSANFTATLDRDDAERALDAGIVASMVVPAKRAGGFQVRFAVRDDASGALGSASQFVEIPDVAGGAFALSGIVLGEETIGVPGEDAAAPAPTAGPALRVFSPGTRLVYAYEVYNAGAPANARATVWRNGKVLFTTPASTLAIPAKAATAKAAGGIKLGDAMPPGDYIFEVSAAVPGKKGRSRVATQSTSFEVRSN